MGTEPQHRHAWIDGSNGVSGDMVLGALVDAGASLEALQAAVDAVLPGVARLQVAQVQRAGLRATKVDVELLVEDQPHRRWRDIRQMIESSGLPEAAGKRALAVFGRLAEAEAHVHGVDVEDVHFHEVGAWDSIADVVGVCAGLDGLGVTSITGGPVALGSGRVRTTHGVLPVPVPAVLELSRGWQVRGDVGRGELATPTGMAIVVALAERCEGLPPQVVSSVGVGAGTKDFPDRPNVVRVVLGGEQGAVGSHGRAQTSAGTAATGTSPGAAEEPMAVLEANVDDLDPRVWPSVLAELLDAGAADAWLVPILMKKGRPAHTLTVLTHREARDALRDRMFELTSTFGVRETAVSRTALERTWAVAVVRDEQVRVKLAHREGRIVTATPEFKDVAELAAAQRIPLRQALIESVSAAERAGLVRGADSRTGGDA